MKKKDKKQKPKRKTILTDHHRLGKILVPKFLTLFEEQFQFVNWVDRMLPEVVWISLLLDSHKKGRAIDIALMCATAAHEIVVPEKACGFAFVSDYGSIKEEHTARLRDKLTAVGCLCEIQESLYPLISLYTQCPLACLFDERDREVHKTDWEKSMTRVKLAVEHCLNRQSKNAMYVQTTAVYLLRQLGVLRYSSQCPPESLEPIRSYPDTDESRKVASSVRATANLMPQLVQDTTWSSYFWEHGYTISMCEFTHSLDSAPQNIRSDWMQEALKAAENYIEKLTQHILQDWNQATEGLPRNPKIEVMAGLISRQFRLATAIASDPKLWSFDLGRIVLRCMVETHIILAWLTKNGEEKDFERFIEYGLGQEKLYYEHVKSQVADSNNADSVDQEDLDALKGWIDAQKKTEFLPVDLGNCFDKNTREMAEEADCKDMHNLMYGPLSSVVHGMWNSLARSNLRVCTNPLHGIHRVPNLDTAPLDLQIPQAAAWVMQLSEQEWQKAMAIEPTGDSPSDDFIENWAKLAEEIAGRQTSSGEDDRPEES